MSDETGQTNMPDRVGFCQDCGKPLTQETIRAVGSGVFCEPCLEARVSGNPAYGAAAGPAAGAPAGYPVPPIRPVQGGPSPAVATLLGFIPGVGAMYNGQYAKGVAHFVIFAVLSSLGDGHSLFGLLCFGWFCYMIFDAYHTAKARRDGLPLPNPFGLNDIGERMGFGKNWGVASHVRAGQRPVAGTAPGPAATPPVPGTEWAGQAPPAGFAGTPPAVPVPPANWAGYVHPAAFTGVPPAAVPDAANWGSTPHWTAYATPHIPTEAVPAVPLTVPARKFPVGAIWLIGLGLVFLLVNLVPDVHINGLWMTCILLTGISVWGFARRFSRPPVGGYAEWIACLRFPVMLMVLALLFALNAAGVKTLMQTWPILFIVFGGLLLIERSAGHAPPPAAYEPPTPGTGFVPKATPPTEPEQAAWTGTDGPPKGGQ